MSDQTFDVGEIAIFWKPGSTNHGLEVTIIRELRLTAIRNTFSGESYKAMAHRVELTSNWTVGEYRGETGCFSIEVICLRKKRLPTQREQISSWDDVVVWRPKQIAMPS